MKEERILPLADGSVQGTKEALMQPATGGAVDGASETTMQPATGGAVAVAVDGVGKTFRGRNGERVRALDGVTFTARADGLTCILGATGSGKSTLLRICAGLETPDAGTVHIAGETPRQARRRIGYVPQHDDLFPWLTLEGNVSLPLRLQGADAAHRRGAAREALARVGLGGRLGAYPHECSGGMRQRAMLARHIVGGADLWLLDEPFSALDERTRRDLQELLLRLRGSLGLTVIFVTHAVEEAVYLADRILVMSIHTNRPVCDLTVGMPHPRERVGVEMMALADAVRSKMESQCSVVGEAGH